MSVADNIRALDRLLQKAPPLQPEQVVLVRVSLAAQSIQWPAAAQAALSLPSLHERVLIVLATIAVVAAAGEPVPAWKIATLRRSVTRYHGRKI